jgi:hypothetical protein
MMLARRRVIGLLSLVYLSLSPFFPPARSLEAVAIQPAAGTYRALLIHGPTGNSEPFVRDRNEMFSALEAGDNWIAANMTPGQIGRNEVSLHQQVEAACGMNGPNDVCLFYYVDHGQKMNENDDEANTGDQLLIENVRPGRRHGCTVLPCDEYFLAIPASGRILDDRLKAVFCCIRGTIIAVFDHCFSGGLDDGTSDLTRQSIPVDQGILFLASSGTNEVGVVSRAWNGHAHTHLSGLLIEGLADGGRGVPRADLREHTGRRPDGKVTVAEWFNYAKKRIGDLFPVTVEIGGQTYTANKQTPEMSAAIADPSTPILTYTRGETSLYRHVGHTRQRHGRAQCIYGIDP